MEKIIESYLCKNMSCPFPGIGTLKITTTHAVASLAERKIHPPAFSVRLIGEVQPANAFIWYIADSRNISIDDAGLQLKQYCEKLQNLDAFGETRLPHIGKFYVNGDAQRVFKPQETQQFFLPEIHAERVIHLQASHTMRVGDLETTSAEMAAYYTDSGIHSRNRWWIPALVLFLACVAAIAFYINDPGRSSTFGNQQKVQTKDSGIQYRLAE